MKKLILKLLVALALHILYFVVIAGIGITNTVLGRKAVWLELSFFSATGNSSVRSLFHRTSIFNSP